MEKIEGHILTELSPVLPSRLSEIKLSKIFPTSKIIIQRKTGISNIRRSLFVLKILTTEIPVFFLLTILLLHCILYIRKQILKWKQIDFYIPPPPTPQPTILYLE